MSKKQLLRDNIAGMQSRLEELEKTEKMMIRNSGLIEQVEQANADKIKHMKDLEDVKTEIEVKKAERSEAVKKSIGPIQDKMNDILSVLKCSALIDINESSISIGMIGEDGSVKPYAGLSDGEKMIFNAALIRALGCGVIIQEGAEIDDINMVHNLIQLQECEEQVIVNTCHMPNPFSSETWRVIRV